MEFLMFCLGSIQAANSEQLKKSYYLIVFEMDFVGGFIYGPMLEYTNLIRNKVIVLARLKLNLPFFS